MSNNPDYIDRSDVGELSVLPPGVFTGTGTAIYSAFGDKAKMQNFASRFFDKATDGEVTAHVISSLAMFVFFNADKLSSPRQPVGWTPNHEFSLTLPIILKFKNQPLKTRLGLWAPYVIIDNARGMVTGRESWGWFKGHGEITSPRDPKTDGVTSALSTLLFKDFDPDTEGKIEELIRIAPKPGINPDFERVEIAESEGIDEDRHACDEFLKLIANGIEDVTVFWDLIKLWKRHEIPAFNLKQFRDAADGTKACYRAITSCPLKINAIHNMSRIKGDLEINITPCESHAIVSQLGFPGNTFDAGPALFTEMDYEADDGEVLWEYQ